MMSLVLLCYDFSVILVLLYYDFSLIPLPPAPRPNGRRLKYPRAQTAAPKRRRPKVTYPILNSHM